MTKIPEERASSWSHLMELLYADSWSKELGRYRSSFAFRGLSDARWSLQTSLIRLGGNSGFLEKHLLRNFRKYAHSHVLDRGSFWFWLTFAQHHGLPTRLLDWTYSPYVALHFATENIGQFGSDAAIWMADYTNLHQFLPTTLSAALSEEGSYVFTTELLSRFEQPETEIGVGNLVGLAASEPDGKKVIDSLSDFDALAKEEFMVFYEPPSLDERVVNQFALFSVLSNPGKNIDEWLEKHPEHVRRVIIPKELKPEVRDKLDQANITERVLFPGLDGLSKWLQRHYSSYP